MHNTSLCDIIVCIPELKLRYIGSFLADFVPKVAKVSFAIMNTSPRIEVVEHWTMICCLNRNYYYADSLEQSVTHYQFSNKKYHFIFLNIHN